MGSQSARSWVTVAWPICSLLFGLIWKVHGASAEDTLIFHLSCMPMEPSLRWSLSCPRRIPCESTAVILQSVSCGVHFLFVMVVPECLKTGEHNGKSAPYTCSHYVTCSRNEFIPLLESQSQPIGRTKSSKQRRRNKGPDLQLVKMCSFTNCNGAMRIYTSWGSGPRCLHLGKNVIHCT